jgi:hypothetical protein
LYLTTTGKQLLSCLPLESCWVICEVLTWLFQCNRWCSIIKSPFMESGKGALVQNSICERCVHYVSQRIHSSLSVLFPLQCLSMCFLRVPLWPNRALHLWHS